ncbi:MAG TPA: biosynthetic peptidoglycan transglycosylase [Streptosporangiaceae bacterium]|nr:biosynthetic peptidoglycan transglycosylase [Streptosporangiaceae bacterium]
MRGTAAGRGRGRGRAYRPWWSRLARTTLGAIVVVICLVLAAFGILMAITPGAGNAQQIARREALRHHSPYPGPQVPARFSAALEATEDHRFSEEPGIDPIAVVRASFSFLGGQRNLAGATLYQQLAKMLYTPGQHGVSVEAKQLALAVKLKFGYSGDQILRMYSDVAYFGHGFYGLERASCGYYGVRPAAMTWPQAALMAGLVQGPSLDDPLTSPGNARAREVHVIGRLVATGAITQAQADRYLKVPLSHLVARAGQSCRA